MRTRQSGFTLIEFSMASLLTMVILGATFTLLHNIFGANDAMGDIMVTQSNVRVALNTLARDITMAGTGLPSGNVAVPGGLNSAPIVRPGMASFPTPDRNIETPNATLPFVSPGNADGPTVAVDTDALTIFTVNQQSPTWQVSSIALFANRYEVTFTQPVNAGDMQLYPGDLVLFNNNNGSVLGCVTDISTSNTARAIFRSTDAMGINQPTAANGNLGSLSNTEPATADYPPTSAIRVNVINYYISVANAAHPRLMRAVNTSAAQVIAEDIENLQFSFDLFDFDTDSGTSNQATTANPNQIRSVLVSIGGRSPERMRNTDDFYRFSLVSKLNVRNSTFRNRYTGS